jgi:glycosyltransferase involved in cell wall biosynthesis
MSVRKASYMRVLALIPSVFDTAPGQRFRIEQWDASLRESGVEIVYAPFECEELHSIISSRGRVGAKLRLVIKAFANRVRALLGVGDFDATYVFREAALFGPAVFEYWIKFSGVPMIFDFDDAVFIPYVSPSNGHLSRLKFPGKTRTICRLSSHVMAGNRHLADYARRVNSNVTIIPTTIDTDKYLLESSKPEAPAPVIGWSGSFSTVQHLDILRAPLRRLAAREKFRLRIIGASDYRLDGVEVESVPWRSRTEIEDLRVIDIGMMPLPSDDWSRGKCGLKALQYMALGIPTICSPVGVNSDIIQDGVNGFLASTEDEWVEKLTTLLHSAELRKCLGLAGRRTVEAKFSARSQIPRVLKIFKSVANKV